MNDTTDRTSTGSPFPETADIETSNDDYATRFRGATGAWMLAVQADIMMQLLRPAPGWRVLDVGGGHAQLTKPLLDAGCRLVVLGSAPSCRHRLEPFLEPGRCDFQVGNVVELPFEDNAFDGVVCFRLFTHCGRWRQLAAELARVSRGPVVFDYPTRQSLNAIAPAFFGAKKRFEKNTRTWTLFRHAQIRDAFGKAGWKIVRRKAQFWMPMVVHRALHCATLSAFLEGAGRCLGLTALAGSPVIARAENASGTPS
ncbi:MAG: class I SAM-dependent methyltransferase [Kiritimatiellia bacterium]|jgi:2-polyprenyl-3-methyl-5-hydroxy-6-metoxy-1,4-benzoquinol methylase